MLGDRDRHEQARRPEAAARRLPPPRQRNGDRLRRLPVDPHVRLLPPLRSDTLDQVDEEGRVSRPGPLDSHLRGFRLGYWPIRPPEVRMLLAEPVAALSSQLIEPWTPLVASSR